MTQRNHNDLILLQEMVVRKWAREYVKCGLFKTGVFTAKDRSSCNLQSYVITLPKTNSNAHLREKVRQII